MDSGLDLTEDEVAQLREWLLSEESRPHMLRIRYWISEQFKKQVDGTAAVMYVDDLVEETVRRRHREVIDAASATAEEEASEDDELNVPGFGRPLGWLPDEEDSVDGDHFPILRAETDASWKAATLTVREVCMLRAVEELTNKPEWWIKCRDDEIAQKWKNEALAMDWGAYREYGDFTPNMAEAVIKEIRYKADLYEETGIIPVMDYSIAAVKSDKILTNDLIADIKAAVAVLEDVPDAQKDWHPGSNNQVLDIVHPSLWPLIYGRSRILPVQRINVEDALKHCGGGHILPEISALEVGEEDQKSRLFQWLPCDVEISPDGKAKIDSYINNVHPKQHASLYTVIEKLIEKSLPAWDVVYCWPSTYDTQRLNFHRVGRTCLSRKQCREFRVCRPSNRRLTAVPEGGEASSLDPAFEADIEESERALRDSAWWEETHPIDKPDAKPDEQPDILIDDSDVRSSEFFDGAERIQVIVKVASIHLTPDSPTYDGGSWHVEGLENEHICATALYYYDSENITDSHLDFRTLADREGLSGDLSMGLDSDYCLERTFAISRQGDYEQYHTTQAVGSVLTRPGRALFFPNLYQHHVSPFKLVDPTKAGHRKIIALFLVDPKIPIISTANVPPQRKDWWEEACREDEEEHAEEKDGLPRLPVELRKMIVDGVDFPYGLEEAKKVRLELMEERKISAEDLNQGLTGLEFGFCEH